MTPVEEIRRAAAQMRHFATYATPGRWTVEYDDDGTLMGIWSAADGNYVVNPYGDGPPGREDCEHIASWHPAVALAVADWLDAEANAMTGRALLYTGATDGFEGALAVARAYLGDRP